MHNRRSGRSGVAAVALASALTLAACGEATGQADAGDVITVYATTGYLADAVAHVAPDAEVETMVGPGGDPHSHQPSTRDVQKLRDADLVFWNGLDLEAQMQDQLESLGDKQLAVGDRVPEQMLLPWEDGLHDPHIWNSPAAWRIVVEEIAEKFAAADPDNAEAYRDNARDYNRRIDQVHQDNLTATSTIRQPRILVTGHDAFGYFGRTYDLEVRATDFISTEAELSATELSELADYIAEHRVPAVFEDNQANPQAITALQEAVAARGWDVAVADAELFADTMGPSAPTDTYLGVLSHNARAVAAELS